MVGLAVIVAALTFVDLTTTASVIEFQRNVEAKGRWVGVISNPDGTLSARSCDSLSRRPWVLYAGGLRRESSTELTKAPGTLFQTASVTSGAPQVWAADPPPHRDLVTGFVVGEQLAAELGLRAESLAVEIDGDEILRVGAVMSVENRYPEAARWLLTIAGPYGRVDECWVEFEPGILEAGLAAASATFRDVSRIDARPLIRLDEFARDPVAEFASRPLAHSWLPVGLLMASLIWLITWFRRADVGLYRAMGTNTFDLWVLVQVESVVVYLLALVSGYAWGVLLFAIQQEGFPGWDQLAVALRAVASAILLAIAVAAFAVVPLGRSQIANQLKDR